MATSWTKKQISNVDVAICLETAMGKKSSQDWRRSGFRGRVRGGFRVGAGRSVLGFMK